VKTRQPRLYFSFRSPYSWMALHRIAVARPDYAEQVLLLPYWDPDPTTEAALRARDAELHYVPMSKAKHLYILQDTKRIAARLGLSMAWPIDIDPWWEVPHLAWLRARRQGQGAELYAALCAARWGRGENICDPQVLRKAADAAGLDGTALAAAVDDPQTRAEGVDCLVRAYDDDVFGIPYGRVGRDRFWGLDRVDDFLRALGDTTGDDPGPGPVAASVPVSAAYDRDTAGGCG
jgi:2-hydroxychromene-2-carboxylate isomerase